MLKTSHTLFSQQECLQWTSKGHQSQHGIMMPMGLYTEELGQECARWSDDGLWLCT